MGEVLRRRLRLIAVVLVGIVAVGSAVLVGYRAGRSVTATAPASPKTSAPLVVKAAAGSLSDVTTMSVSLSWSPVAQVRNHLAGIVTRSAFKAGEPFELKAGATVLWVNEVAVIALPGEIPAYRDLGPSAVGADVAQLQTFLASIGRFGGQADGRWGPSTTVAVKAWQHSMRADETGLLPFGSLVFVRSMPVRVAAPADVAVGAPLAPDQVMITVLEPLPTARLLVPSGSSRDVTAAASIVADVGGTSLAFQADGPLGTDSQSGQGTVGLSLASAVTACDTWCDEVGTDTPLLLPATLTFSPRTDGPLVPVGVLHTTGANVTVTMADGSVRAVKVLLQIEGQAILSGINVGDEVLVASGTG